jgi:hypothetical protein
VVWWRGMEKESKVREAHKERIGEEDLRGDQSYRGKKRGGMVDDHRREEG